MKELLIIMGLSALLLILAVLGLAVKTIFTKDGQLTTCRGAGGSDQGCGCEAADACNTTS